MKCTRCSHPHEQHRLAHQKCATRIAFGWDEAAKTFAGSAPCLCCGYRGVLPGDKCPHEFTKSSQRCVHCNHVSAEEKKT